MIRKRKIPYFLTMNIGSLNAIIVLLSANSKVVNLAYFSISLKKSII